MVVGFEDQSHGLREEQHQVVRSTGGGIRVRDGVRVLQEELPSLGTSMLAPLPAKV